MENTYKEIRSLYKDLLKYVSNGKFELEVSILGYKTITDKELEYDLMQRFSEGNIISYEFFFTHEGYIITYNKKTLEYYCTIEDLGQGGISLISYKEFLEAFDVFKNKTLKEFI